MSQEQKLHFIQRPMGSDFFQQILGKFERCMNEIPILGF